MNPVEERHRPRVALIEAGARGGGFERETHLDVGGGEGVAGEPFVLAEFTFPVRHMLLELRIDQRRQGLVGTLRTSGRNNAGARFGINVNRSFSSSGGIAEPSA